MLQMTKPLLAILLLLPLSVSAGELDGKSLVGSYEVKDLGKMAITENANSVTWKYMNMFP